MSLSVFVAAALAAAGLAFPLSANASFLPPEMMDTAATGLAWFVLIVMPIVAIVLFWLVHVLPEKIAHKRHHPQRDAIHTLCLLSLVFGGLLWPIAWIWAYSKPVLYQLAYGRDKEVEDPGGAVSLHAAPLEPVETPPAAAAAIASEAEDVAALKQRVASLEMQLAAASAQAAGRARGPETGGA
jgi:CBS domain containing-hemolysin-like protein